MRLWISPVLFLFVVMAVPAQAETEAAEQAHEELEQLQAEAAEPAAAEPASEPAEAAAEPEAAPEPEPEAAPEPEPEPAKVVEPEAPAVSAKIAGLNAGAQIVFALLDHMASIKGAAETSALRAQMAAARGAGAFSVSGGAWVDLDVVERNPDAVRKALEAVNAKLLPLAEVDPTDGDSVTGKKKELLEALPPIETLIGAAGAPARQAQLLKDLGQFKLALDPPYAYGHSKRRVMAWGAAGVGAMVTMAGLGSLSNPLERERSAFGWIATGVGLTAAGVGAAMIVLDDR